MHSSKDWRAISIMVWQSILNNKDRPMLFFDDIAHDVSIAPRHLNYPLSYIMEFCERMSLPPLTAIVMNKHDYLRRGLRRPSPYLRLQHNSKFCFPHDEQFDVLYQQQVEIIKSTDWSSIEYKPSNLTFYELRKQLMKTRYKTERKTASLAWLINNRR